MKKRISSYFMIPLFFAIVVGYNNCNPVSFKDGVKGLGDMKSQDIIVGNPLTSSKTILQAMCKVITRCHPEVASSMCESGILQTGGIDYQFGLIKGSFANYSAILQSETSGQLSANQTGTNTCVSAIDSLTCTDPTVISAYDPSASSPFSKVSFMIPTAPGACPAVFSQPPNRKEYFVATTGSDSNDGTAGKPWATITHASQALIPTSEGAIVHVAPGNYTVNAMPACSASSGQSCGILTARSGTATAPIIYISDRQWGAKILSVGAFNAWYNSGDFIQIIGFEITGDTAGNNGILNDGSSVQVIGNHIHDFPVTDGCAQGWGYGGVVHLNPSGHDNDTIGNTIHDIGPRPGNGQATNLYCNHSHGISYENVRGKVQNNRLYRIGAWAVHSFEGSGQLTITNNLIFDAGGRDKFGTGFGGGIAIAAANGFPLHDGTTVSNNILRNISSVALYDLANTGNNNVFYNNLLYSNYNNFALKSAGESIGTITADPLMVDFRLDGSGNYQLQANSPAINAGSSSCAPGTSTCIPSLDFAGVARPFGPAIDVGPYEWHP